jgi:hypothetical protein
MDVPAGMVTCRNCGGAGVVATGVVATGVVATGVVATGVVAAAPGAVDWAAAACGGVFDEGTAWP